MINPLWCNKDSIIVGDETINSSNVGKHFPRIYILAPFNKIDDYSKFNNEYIDIEYYKQQLSKMILTQFTPDLLRNPTHFSNMIYIKASDISSANYNNYELPEMIIVIPYFNISSTNVLKYINNTTECDNMEELYNTVLLCKYFKDDLTKPTNIHQIWNLINTLNCANYWKKSHNCKCNISEIFNKRNFLYKGTRIGSPINYLNSLFKQRKYIDPSSIIKKIGFRVYYKVFSCPYSIININDIFNEITIEPLRFSLFCQLLVSKKYCHLMINNRSINCLMKNYINKFMDILEYLYSYGWIRLYFEECISKYNMSTSDMFIFDINTASELPVFHFDYENPHRNPYMPILVGKYSLNPGLNIGGVGLNGSITHRICNIEEFTQRMNIFISNDENTNLLEGIDFAKLKLGITGSIMTACLQYNHPLLQLFADNSTSINNKYNRFFTEYYPNSDIDIMVETDDMLEFISTGKMIYEQITNNLVKIHTDMDKNHVTCRVEKQIYLFVSHEFIKKNIDSDDLPYEMIIDNLCHLPIINLFKPLLLKLHKIEIQKVMDQYNDMEQESLKQTHPEYFDFDIKTVVIKLSRKITDIEEEEEDEKKKEEKKEEDEEEKKEDQDIYAEDFEQEDEKIIETKEQDEFIDIENCSISINIKVHISSPYLDHPFEIFPIKGKNLMTAVGKFHMPCVRAYYDGSNVYMTPSCISAHMTFMNIDYKYFASNTHPIEIINKYRMRGFGTWLNKTEIDSYIQYNIDTPFWKNLLNTNSNKKELLNCLGPLPINYRIFHPRHFNQEYYNEMNIKPIPFDNPYNTINIVEPMSRFTYMKNRYNCKNSSELKPVFNESICSKTGYINKLSENMVHSLNHIFQCE
jgi:hypothetical protein